MKFVIPGKTFQQQLQAMSRVLNTKNALQILDNFHFKVEGDKLWITASDSENVMVSWMEIFEAQGEGEVALSSKSLIDMAKEIGNQPITFEMNDENFHIDVKYQNGHFEFMGIDGAEYPRKAPEEQEEIREMILPAEVVRKGIENTLFAVSPENIRPIMTGIFWDIAEDKVTFVSSDTHKLVRYINRQAAPGFEGGFILPSKPSSILRSVIDKETSEVKVKMNSKGAVFEFDCFTLSCKFIKGAYPNYNRVIPQDQPYKLTVSREALLTALRRVALFASKSTSLVRLDVRPAQILLDARDFDYSTQAEEKVDCNYDGPSMIIGFNNQYMIEILNNLKDDDLVISLIDPARPGIFRPLKENPDEEILILQMPMQVVE